MLLEVARRLHDAAVTENVEAAGELVRDRVQRDTCPGNRPFRFHVNLSLGSGQLERLQITLGEVERDGVRFPFRQFDSAPARLWKAQIKVFLFRAQCGDWIHIGGAAGRNKTGEKRGHGKHYARNDQGERIARTYLIQNLGQDAAGG